MRSRPLILVAGVVLACTAAGSTAAVVRGHTSVAADQEPVYAAPTQRAPADVANPPTPGRPGSLPAFVADDPFIRSQNLTHVRSTRIAGIYTGTASNGDTCLIVSRAGFAAGCSPARANHGVVSVGTGMDLDTGRPLPGGNERLYGVTGPELITASVGATSSRIDGGVFALDVTPGAVVTLSGPHTTVRIRISRPPLVARP